MRKVMVVLMLVVLVLALVTGTAAAQKDPFHPVIDPDAATGTTTTTSTTTGSNEGTFTPPTVGSEGLANTGADVEPWLVLAYGLIVVGGGVLAAGRLLGPHPTKR